MRKPDCDYPRQISIGVDPWVTFQLPPSSKMMLPFLSCFKASITAKKSEVTFLASFHAVDHSRLGY